MSKSVQERVSFSSSSSSTGPSSSPSAQTYTSGMFPCSQAHPSPSTGFEWKSYVAESNIPNSPFTDPTYTSSSFNTHTSCYPVCHVQEDELDHHSFALYPFGVPEDYKSQMQEMIALLQERVRMIDEIDGMREKYEKKLQEYQRWWEESRQASTGHDDVIRSQRMKRIQDLDALKDVFFQHTQKFLKLDRQIEALTQRTNSGFGMSF